MAFVWELDAPALDRAVDNAPWEAGGDYANMIEDEASKVASTTATGSKITHSTIHKDKRMEEYWAFMKAVPGIQTNYTAPALNRCPSLTMSRNSSAKSMQSTNSSSSAHSILSARSLYSIMWDTNEHGPREVSEDRDQYGSEHFLAPQRFDPWPLSTETKPKIDSKPLNPYQADVDITLRCNFCIGGDVTHHGPDAVVQLREHMIKRHGAMNGSVRSYVSLFGSTVCPTSNVASIAKCSICTEPFGPQAFFDHLYGCVLRAVARPGSLYFIDDDEVAAEDKDNIEHDLEHVGGFATHDSIIHEETLQSVEKFGDDEMDIDGSPASSRCMSLTSSAALPSSDEETDDTEEQTSRESSPGQSQVRRRLTPAKMTMITNIMKEFQRYIKQSCTGSSSASGSSDGCGGAWSSTTSVSSATTSTSRKRSLGKDETPPEEDDDGDAPKRRRPVSRQIKNELVTDSRFACPYYKRNPGKHLTFTSCRDPGFLTVARLKEHLYRRHLLPPQCHRCCQTFTNDVNLRLHQRDPDGCEVREQVPLEGFDKDQQQQLKSKKKSQSYQTEEEKWRGIYHILFPDDTEADIPSPYIEYQLSGARREETPEVNFQEFSRLQLPQLVRRTLETIVEQEAQPLEERLKEQLVDIVRSCQEQLVSMFQATQGPSQCGKEPMSEETAQATVQNVEFSQKCLNHKAGLPKSTFNFVDSLPSHDNTSSEVIADGMDLSNAHWQNFEHRSGSVPQMPSISLVEYDPMSYIDPGWTSNEVHVPGQPYSSGNVADSDNFMWPTMDFPPAVASTGIFDLDLPNENTTGWHAG